MNNFSKDWINENDKSRLAFYSDSLYATDFFIMLCWIYLIMGNIFLYFSKFLKKYILLNSFFGRNKHIHYGLTIFYMVMTNIKILLAFYFIDTTIKIKPSLIQNISHTGVPRSFSLLNVSIILQMLSTMIFIYVPVATREIIHNTEIIGIKSSFTYSMMVIGYSFIMFLCWNFIIYYCFTMWRGIYNSDDTRIQYIAKLRDNCMSIFGITDYEMGIFVGVSVIIYAFAITTMHMTCGSCSCITGNNIFDKHFSPLIVIVALIYFMLGLEHVIKISLCRF